MCVCVCVLVVSVCSRCVTLRVRWWCVLAMYVFRQLTFYWNRPTREVSVRVTRGTIDSKLSATNTFLARFPVDSLHLVMYGDNANEIIQVFGMDGYTKADDGACVPVEVSVCGCEHTPSVLVGVRMWGLGHSSIVVCA